MKSDIRINPARIGIILLTISVGLTVIYLLLLTLNLDFSAATRDNALALFNVNAEASIPTWYAQTLLFVAAFILFAIFAISKSDRRMWLSLGIIFTYMSIDEGAAIHELTVHPISSLFGITSGVFYYSWVLLFLLIALIVVAVYARFWWRLPIRTRILVATAAVAFVSGAIGLEMIGGQIAAASGETGMAYSVVVGGEEFLEMFGTGLFIYALLGYSKGIKAKLTIKA